MAPFSIDLFKGMLAFFLLDMGLMVAKNFKQVLNKPIYVLFYGIFAPPVHALLALIICKIAGVGLGETILLMVLSASASYIALPPASSTRMRARGSSPRRAAITQPADPAPMIT